MTDRSSRIVVTACFLTSGSILAQPSETCFFNATNGHTYLLTSQPLHVADARSEAAALGGYLVAINDAAENAFLVSSFGPFMQAHDQDPWIGLSDELAEGSFLWDSGEALTYTNWRPGEPNDFGCGEDHAHIRLCCASDPTYGSWNDYPGDTSCNPGAAPWYGIIEVPGLLACPGTPRPPECSEATASAASCWPPSHRFTLVEILGVTDPDGDPVTITITGVTQDEPVKDQGKGSGNTCPDAVLVDFDGDGNAEAAGVRCERSGNPKVPGNGRVYAIQFTATDDTGASCEGTVTFCVPHDQRPGATCVDDGQSHDSIESCSIANGGGGSTRPVYALDAFNALTPEPLFFRGDVDWNEDLVINDGVLILMSLFHSQEPLDCEDAADVNDDGDVDISDAISFFSYLFLGGYEPPPPVLFLASDSTEDRLGCDG